MKITENDIKLLIEQVEILLLIGLIISACFLIGHIIYYFVLFLKFWKEKNKGVKQ